MRVAAIDVGTNTARLLIADVVEGRVRDVDRRAVVVGLGSGVDRTGRLSEDAIARTMTALSVYAAAIREHCAKSMRAVATSASRDAENVGEFLDRAEAVLGARPEVIGSAEEAALSFRGATTGIPGPGPTLVIDPGGGSTEFVVGGVDPVAATSVDIGSVRLTERLLPEHPASADRVATAAAEVAAMFSRVPIPGPPARAIGVAGTFTSLAAVHLELIAYDRDRVHGAVMTVEDFDALVEMLAGLTVEQTAAIPSLEPGRAPVLLGGAVVAREAVRRSGLGRVTVSESDLLDGIALGLAE